MSTDLFINKDLKTFRSHIHTTHSHITILENKMLKIGRSLSPKNAKKFIDNSLKGFKGLPTTSYLFQSITIQRQLNTSPRHNDCASSGSNNMNRLQGKVAIVTASTEGIGFAIARRLAEEGASVVVSSRKQSNVTKAVNELRKANLNVTGVKCHVGEANDRKQLFEETIRTYGKLNILVSNAATNPVVGGVMECDEKVWDKIFDVNVKSSFLLAKEALPYLRLQEHSNIVFVSSIAGYDALDLLGAYSVSKTALIGLTKAAAKNLAPEGIRVNCLAPGIIKTKFSKALYEDEAANEESISRIPLNRLGLPEEMGGVVAFLVSDDASYITGETIVAAGGMSARL